MSLCGLSNEVEEQTPDSRFAALAKTTLWFDSKMANQRSARQLERKPLPVAVFNNVCQGAGRIDEHDIARNKLHLSIVLSEDGATYDLKYRDVMIHAIQSNIPFGSLNTVSVATNIHCDESVRTSAARPAGKALGPYIRCWVILSPIRTKCISPTLAIEFTRAEKIVALRHLPLHLLMLSQQPRQITCDDHYTRMWSDRRRPSAMRITGGEDLIRIDEPADDLGLSTICAITAGPPSRTDKRRMARPPKINTFILGAAG